MASSVRAAVETVDGRFMAHGVKVKMNEARASDGSSIQAQRGAVSAGCSHGRSGDRPIVCKYVDCPRYDILERYDDCTELREYDSADWISVRVSQSENGGYEGASISGSHRIFTYLLGHNEERKKLRMGAPVVTVLFRDGGRRTQADGAVPKDDVPSDDDEDDDEDDDDDEDVDPAECVDDGSDSEAARRCREVRLRFKDYIDVSAPVPLDYQGAAPVPRDPAVQIVHIKRTQVYARSFFGFATARRVHEVARIFLRDLKDHGCGPLDRVAILIASYDPPIKIFDRYNEVLIIKDVRP